MQAQKTVTLVSITLHTVVLVPVPMGMTQTLVHVGKTNVQVMSRATVKSLLYRTQAATDVLKTHQ